MRIDRAANTPRILETFKKPPTAAATHGHTAQFQDDDFFLFQAVGRFLAGGYRAGEALVVLATAAHRAGIKEASVPPICPVPGVQSLTDREFRQFQAFIEDRSEFI